MPVTGLRPTAFYAVGMTTDPQTPAQHARWDGRFSAIVSTGMWENGASQFRYELGLGIHAIRETGVSLGDREGRNGERTSALAFDSADRLSPLAEVSA
ncbi:hypothetical protein RS85_01684 [Microbacterium sp. SA39]|nr:hypothetical protein RS85_01684 [Microbacterium sp. SA39]